MTDPRTPHKHAAVIKAWADGAEIEWKHPNSNMNWVGTPFPSWNTTVDYRVKPVPHPQQDLVDAVKRGELGIQVKWPWGSDWMDVDGPQRCSIVFPHEAQLRRRHKWQKEMDAQAAGKVVQYRMAGSKNWLSASQTTRRFWNFDGEGEYRIKPGHLVTYGRAALGAGPWVDFQFSFSYEECLSRDGQDNLKLTFEDGKLIAAEVLNG